MAKTAEQRFSEKCRVDPKTGCVEWIGYTNVTGYGQFWGGGRLVLAHRWSYGLDRIPAGLVIDHLCRNPPCVNPEHLEPVTQHENARRGKYAQQTHCKSGHEFNDKNTHVKANRWRQCRPCQRERQARYWAKVNK